MASTLLLIPLDDTVVFPTMDVTLPVDPGDDERVLLVPRHEGEYARVGTIARVANRVRLPGGARGAHFEGVARGIAGAAHTDAAGRLRVEVVEHPDDVPVDGRTRELEREYRATVEEILDERGDDGRIANWLRAIKEPGALADTAGYAPDLTFEQKVELLETTDVTERISTAIAFHRERLAGPQVPRRTRAAPVPPPQPRRRRGGRRQAAARVRAAQADGVDPPLARRGRRLLRRRVPREDRGGRHAGGRARAGRARAGPPRAHGRVERRVVDDPHVPRLADLRAVERALRGPPRPQPHARGPRRRPRRPRGRQGPHRRVRRGEEAARGAGDPGGQEVRRHPHAHRPARHRQDLDRRVHRPRDGPRVCPHVARRRARRGRDPRPPAHVHRRAPGPAGPRAT